MESTNMFNGETKGQGNFKEMKDLLLIQALGELLKKPSEIDMENLLDSLKRQIEREKIQKNQKHNIKFSLNFELAQCISKTNKCLKTIALLHNNHKQKYKYKKMNGKPVKLISFVFTNNSLLETKAWKNRTAAKFNNGEIIVQKLASDTNKNAGDYKKGVEIISAFTTYAGIKNNNETIGDVIVMCNHPTRINDILKLIETLDGLISRHDVQFKFNLYFDECDDGMCLSNMVRFIKTIYEKELEYFIDEIQLITATPSVEMLRKLKRITPDAEKLFNINKHINEEVKVREINYKTILNQEYIQIEGKNEPVDYVKDIYNNRREIFSQGKIYFIPAGYYVVDHNEMAELEIFKDMGFWILVLNGQEKGFRNPLGEKFPLDFTNGGELRDLLRKWRVKHPDDGLIITGNTVLKRGLTFLTNGFCFDYMIISKYLANKITDLIQLVGRGQGNENYVGNFKVIMPKSLYELTERNIKDAERILEEDHEFYDLDLIGSIGKIDLYENIETHFELSLEELNKWVQENLLTKEEIPAKVKVSWWRKKNKDSNGFILHKFGGNKKNRQEEKIWSEEEALKQRGGLQPYQRRIIPCYTDINDVNTLKWYVIYRND